jgi:uncharacterized membrane protein
MEFIGALIVSFLGLWGICFLFSVVLGVGRGLMKGSTKEKEED